MSRNSQPLRVAHRGGSYLAPENTLSAFRNALTLPIDVTELDVHMSRDGQLVVIHDPVVERRTDGWGNILDLDFAYLRSLDAAAHFPGGWPRAEQIPTLREALDVAKGRTPVFIDIKPSRRGDVFARYPHIEEAVLEEVRHAGILDQVMLLSFDWKYFPLIKALEPAMPTGALVAAKLWDAVRENAFEILVDQVTALGCAWINLHLKLFEPAMIAIAHAHGLKFGVWNVNILEDMRRLAAAGVDAITSDRPDLFAAM
jgi:glycerophosphoryl diester phosphodiesterase